MKIINIVKIKRLIIFTIILVVCIAFLALFLSLRKPTSNKDDKDLVLEPVPYTLLASSSLFKTSYNNIEYALNEKGEIIFKDKDGSTYTIDTNGNVYRIEENGEKVLVNDDTKKNEILLSALEARENDPWIQSLLEDKSSIIKNINPDLLDKSDIDILNPEEYKKTIDDDIDKLYDELLNILDKDMTKDELKELISKNGLKDLDFLNMIKEVGPEKALEVLKGKNRDLSKNNNPDDTAHQKDRSFLVSLAPPSSTSTKDSTTTSTHEKDRELNWGSNLDTMALLNANKTKASWDEQNRQDEKLNFLNKNSTSPIKFTTPDNYTLAPGTIIPITLITELNTDLPGTLIAQASTNIYDSAQGENLLIEKGERFIGSYDSSLSYGQKRVLVVWDTLIKNDGTIINLPSLIGVDKMGASGWTGKTSSHIGSVILSAGISSLINISTEALDNITDSPIVNTLLKSTAKGSGSVVENFISKELNRQPTITIKRGRELNIIVTKPINFKH